MAITAGEDILASDFIDASSGAGDSGKGVKLNASGVLDRSFNATFGGDGSDGAFAETSGTTTYDFAGARYLVLNYTSFSLTSTADIDAENPHAEGSVLIIRSQGDVTITSSNGIDLQLMGGLESRGMCAGLAGVFYGGGDNEAGGAGGTGGGADVIASKGGGDSGNESWSYAAEPTGCLPPLTPLSRMAYAGSGGAHGVNNGGTGNGVGGVGGGGLVIECRGTYTFTTGTINTSGENGTTATGGASVNQGGSGGGGGGSAGGILVNCGTLGTDSGTYTQTAGTGGGGSPAGTPSGGSPSAGGSGGTAGAASNLRQVNLAHA